MPIINISVKDKIAQAECGALIVCKNTDYEVHFDFDSEWDSYIVKTAKFAFEGDFIPVVFSGNRCAVPKLPNTFLLGVEVQSGNLKTATPAWIECQPVLDDSYGEIEPPTPDVYSQLMQMIKDGVLTGAKIVDTIYIGVDEKGGNVYKQIFDNGTENYFTAPKGLDSNVIIGEDVGTAYDGAKGAKNASDILSIFEEITKIYQSIRKNSENISDNMSDTNTLLDKKLDKSGKIANGNLIKYNSQTQKIEDSGISKADIDKNAKDISAQSKKLGEESLKISQNTTDIRRLGASVELDSATIKQNTIDISNITIFLEQLSNRLNTILNSDDVTLDQLSEIVAYIKSNKNLIDEITTSKVSVSDIVDNLTTYDDKKPLSANQGAELNNKLNRKLQKFSNYSDTIKVYAEQVSDEGSTLVEASSKYILNSIVMRGQSGDQHSGTFDIDSPETDPESPFYSPQHPVTLGFAEERYLNSASYNEDKSEINEKIQKFDELNISNGIGKNSIQSKNGNAKGENSVDFGVQNKQTKYTKRKELWNNNIVHKLVLTKGNGYAIELDSYSEVVFTNGYKLIHDNIDNKDELIFVNDVGVTVAKGEMGKEIVVWNDNLNPLKVQSVTLGSYFSEDIGNYGWISAEPCSSKNANAYVISDAESGALGENSFATGYRTIAYDGQTALGSMNAFVDGAILMVGKGSYLDTDDDGIGDEESRRNVFVIMKDGTVRAGMFGDRPLAFADDVDNEIGDISSALDELHGYAENLISGVV